MQIYSFSNINTIMFSYSHLHKIRLKYSANDAKRWIELEYYATEDENNCSRYLYELFDSKKFMQVLGDIVRLLSAKYPEGFKVVGSHDTNVYEFFFE